MSGQLLPPSELALQLAAIDTPLTNMNIMELLADQAQLEEMANLIAATVADYYIAEFGPLPEVCEGGQACRDEIWNRLKNDLAVQWQATLIGIQTEFENAWFRSSKVLEDTWEEAYECPSGCVCDNIMTEYAEIVSLQKEILTEIQILEHTKQELREQETTVMEECPGYHPVVIGSETEYFYGPEYVEDEFNTEITEGEWEETNRELIAVTPVGAETTTFAQVESEAQFNTSRKGYAAIRKNLGK